MLRVRRARTGTRFLRWALIVSAAFVAAAPPAGAETADARRALGKIERESVDDALASLGARIDPAL